MTHSPYRLLSVGHSYAVALNRRLPHEIACVSKGRWEVTAVAPRFVRAELRDIPLELDANELCKLEAVRAYGTRYLHIMAYDFHLREILRRDWDMVHVYQEPYIVAGWQVAYWARNRAPYVFFTNQNIAKRYPAPFSWMEHYCVNHCAGWIGCGESVVEALLKKGYEGKPHRRIGFGVDVGEFRPDNERRQYIRRHLGWDDSVPVISFLGRFVPEKGVDLLVSVLDRIQLPWRALFIGSGPGQDRLKKWSVRYPDRVRVVAVSHEQVPTYLNAADILCAPSQTTSNWREQFGRMIIEGFASGLVIVGSDSGELPNVIGDAGFVVRENDEASWVRILEQLIQDKALCAEYSERGRARAQQNFSWPVIARQHIDFFEQLLMKD